MHINRLTHISGCKRVQFLDDMMPCTEGISGVLFDCTSKLNYLVH